MMTKSSGRKDERKREMERLRDVGRRVGMKKKGKKHETGPKEGRMKDEDGECYHHLLVEVS